MPSIGARLKLSANNLGLTLDASKRRNNEQRNTVPEGCGFEIAPSFRSGGYKQMLSSVCSNFCNFKAACLFTDAQAASRYHST
jgi:hypothetical protein